MEISDKVLDKAEELTDEKYDFLEHQEKIKKNIGEKFDIDSESNVWYTIKIAELILMQEKLIKLLEKR